MSKVQIFPSCCRLCALLSLLLAAACEGEIAGIKVRTGGQETYYSDYSKPGISEEQAVAERRACIFGQNGFGAAPARRDSSGLRQMRIENCLQQGGFRR